MKRFLVVVVLCLPVFGQAAYSGPGSYSGAGQWSMVSGGSSTLFAALPINWVDSGDICSTSSYDNTVYVDGGSGTGHYAETPAGLLGALTDWSNAADQWWHIIVPAGALLHGSTYDSNNSLITLPAKAGRRNARLWSLPLLRQPVRCCAPTGCLVTAARAIPDARTTLRTCGRCAWTAPRTVAIGRSMPVGATI
jgi:hypothetical protein